LGIAPTPKVLDQLAHYAREIEFWNPKYGLVNAQGEDLMRRHFLDSLVAVPFLERLAPRVVADVGSGGGFPGIPLALYFPEIPFVLIERSGKRVRFLENVVNVLSLGNVRVLQSPVEECLESFDLITFRAVSELSPDFVSALLRRLKTKGQIMAYKGKRRVIEEELLALDDLGLQSSVQKVRVPGLDEERHLVFLKKP
jgi:16S rRNA (guanine527-N7)-methyltransferase